MANAIPDGYTSLTTYLYVRGADAAIDFYKRAFGAVEIMRLDMGPVIGHAELRIGNAVVMLADEMPEWGNKSPQTLGGVASGMCYYTEDCDAVFAQAIAAGATEMRPLTDQFYGDRSGTVTDPFGHTWTIATHKEDLTPDEMNARMDAWTKSQK